MLRSHLPQDDLADVQHRLANGGGSQPPAVPPLPPPVAKGSMIDVFGNVVPPIALDQVGSHCCRCVQRWSCAHTPTSSRGRARRGQLCTNQP